jgi:hypothetical protein
MGAQHTPRCRKINIKLSLSLDGVPRPNPNRNPLAALQTPPDVVTMSSPMLLFSVSGTQLSFRASLLTADNPSIIALVRDQLPLESVLGHVVISGETFWVPTRILSLGKGNMVQRQPGAVYYYAPGQTICVCYGRITESAKINQFSRVLEADFDNLQAIGKLVYQQTVADENPTIVRIKVSLIWSDGDTGFARELNLPLYVSAAPTEDAVMQKFSPVWKSVSRNILPAHPRLLIPL